jgi:multiple antibiotic resistance protein
VLAADAELEIGAGRAAALGGDGDELADAVPTVVTPWGVAAILIFVELADSDSRMLPTVVGILLLVMLLNLIGMLLARRIIAAVDIVTFQVVGWIFAVLQAGFAVDAVVTSLRNLALFRT